MKRGIKPRLAWYFAATLGFIVAGLLCYEFRFRLPVGYGGAGHLIDSASFKKTWSTREVVVVGLGDSVTAGFGARKGYSYFDRVVTNPPDDFAECKGLCLSSVFPNMRATNLAVSGSTSAQILKAEFSRLTVYPSNVFGLVMMTTGGNDVIHDYGRGRPRETAMYGASFEQARPWIANFETRLETMVTQLNKCFPGGCEIFLANIYDPTDGVGDPQRVGLPKWKDNQMILGAYNEILAKSASKHANIHLVDMQGLFMGHGIHCREFWRGTYVKTDPHYWYNENLEDPNERGYDALRRLFLKQIADVYSNRQ